MQSNTPKYVIIIIFLVVIIVVVMLTSGVRYSSSSSTPIFKKDSYIFDYNSNIKYNSNSNLHPSYDYFSNNNYSTQEKQYYSNPSANSGNFNGTYVDGDFDYEQDPWNTNGPFGTPSAPGMGNTNPNNPNNNDGPIYAPNDANPNSSNNNPIYAPNEAPSDSDSDPTQAPNSEGSQSGSELDIDK